WTNLYNRHPHFSPSEDCHPFTLTCLSCQPCFDCPSLFLLYLSISPSIPTPLSFCCSFFPNYFSLSLCFSLCISGVFCNLLVAKLDFLQVKHLKRKRKSNYTVRETQTLISEIHKRRDVLFSRQQNTAINELKRQAWEEVARGVNSLGEGELRTAAEVKRRYLDWRALMKRKQLQAELSLSSSSALSFALKTEYNQSSPEHDAASLGSGCDQLLDLSGLPKDCHCDWPELVALSEPSGQATMAPPGTKMEYDVSEYRLDGDGDVGDGDGEIDEDEIPSLLSDIESRGEGHAGDVYSHNGLGVLSTSKAPTSASNRDLPLAAGLMGVPPHALGGLTNHENMGAGFLVAVEKQRLELEKQRLAMETERLAVEKERLVVEKERLRQMEVERERLQLERERLQVERERLRLLLLSQSDHIDSSFNLLPQQGPPSSSTLSLSCIYDGQREREKEGKGWMSVVDLETERLKLEKERLQLEKERLQFFKFEAGRLQIERELLQVEKERMQLHKDYQSH
ncbi:myb/SANT-like DNA-binding domain-containing protein 4, partial [Xiphias gladius]|uniref:myb/SANT-like DNA-binding domain-containing protein 4 n=1 Tax=Xiphias gladius TaxID=8245 RepID=UPI001A9891B3